MPDYTFVCQQCGTQFEEHLSFNANRARLSCPNGHKNVRRVYTTPQIIFHGNGYYVTDHKKKDKTP